MKRLSVLLLVGVLLGLAACGPSPREEASDFVRYLPDEIGEWELDDGATTELLSSTITSMGHVILQYEGPDDALAYIVVEVYPSEDAAEVAMVDRERLLRLSGLTLEADRAGQPTAQVAQTETARLAVIQEGKFVVEVDALAAEGEDPVSEEAFAELLSIARNAFERLGD
ncbi:MAG: hypothetical protein GXY36_07010 [Chloroflexi bacterium]|nr:hypothetical protein [Chloroflexota bacterium]